MTPSILTIDLHFQQDIHAGFGASGSLEKDLGLERLRENFNLKWPNFIQHCPANTFEHLEVQRTGAGVNTKLSITAVIKIYKDLVKGKGMTRTQNQSVLSNEKSARVAKRLPNFQLRLPHMCHRIACSI